MKKLFLTLVLPVLILSGACKLSSAARLQGQDIIEKPANGINEINGIIVGKNYEPGDENSWRYLSLYLIGIKNTDGTETVIGDTDIRTIILNSLSYRDMIDALGLPSGTSVVKVLVRTAGNYCLRIGSFVDLVRTENDVWRLAGTRSSDIENRQEDDIGLPSSAKVLGVIDGGVLILKFPNSGSFARAGLMGIEIPYAGDDDCGSPYAGEAREFLGSMVSGKTVGLVWDSHGKVSVDRRMLPYVLVGGETVVNAELIKRGLAVVTEGQDTDKKRIYKKLEAEAKKKESESGANVSKYSCDSACRFLRSSAVSQFIDQSQHFLMFVSEESPYF